MPLPPNRRTVRVILWLGLSVLAFAAAAELGSGAFALVASLALFGALLSVGRIPRTPG